MTATDTKTRHPDRGSLAGTKSSADKWFRWILTLAGTSVLVILATMLLFTVIDAWPVFRHEGWSFVFSSTWDPGVSRTEITGQYGALAFIVGTLLTSAIALLIAVPLAVGTALVPDATLRPVASGTSLTYAVELLAAVPSVVYGLWGLLFFVPTVLRPAMDFIVEHVWGFIPFLGGRSSPTTTSLPESSWPSWCFPSSLP